MFSAGFAYGYGFAAAFSYGYTFASPRCGFAASFAYSEAATFGYNSFVLCLLFSGFGWFIYDLKLVVDRHVVRATRSFTLTYGNVVLIVLVFGGKEGNVVVVENCELDFDGNVVLQN